MLTRFIPFAIVAVAIVGAAAFAQQPAAQLTPAQVRFGERAPLTQAPLFFREEWKTAPAGGEHVVTQDAVTSPNLELKLYGESSKEIQELGKAGDAEQSAARLDRALHLALRRRIARQEQLRGSYWLGQDPLGDQSFRIPPSSPHHQAGRRNLAGGRPRGRIPDRLARERIFDLRSALAEAGSRQSVRPRAIGWSIPI